MTRYRASIGIALVATSFLLGILAHAAGSQGDESARATHLPTIRRSHNSAAQGLLALTLAHHDAICTASEAPLPVERHDL